LATQPTDLPRLLAAIRLCEGILGSLGEDRKGYIIQKPKGTGKGKGKQKPLKMLDGGSGGDSGGVGCTKPTEKLFHDEFQPFLHKQHEGKPTIEFPSFDRAADVFFSEIEAQRVRAD
jgi:hypothetical protein